MQPPFTKALPQGRSCCKPQSHFMMGPERSSCTPEPVVGTKPPPHTLGPPMGLKLTNTPVPHRPSFLTHSWAYKPEHPPQHSPDPLTGLPFLTHTHLPPPSGSQPSPLTPTPGPIDPKPPLTPGGSLPSHPPTPQANTPRGTNRPPISAAPRLPPAGLRRRTSRAPSAPRDR